MSPERLVVRVMAWQLLFSAIAALVLYRVPPFLLLLSGDVGQRAAVVLTLAVLLGGSFTMIQAWSVVMTRRQLLSQLARGQRGLDQLQLPKLNDDPWLIANGWVIITCAAVILSMTALRPPVIPPSTALTLGLFAVVIVAALALPLLVLVRADFVRVMQQVPPDVMGEVIDAQIRSGHLRGRTSRRLLAAVVTPVAFLAVGSALIAGAHVRAADEADRQAMALSVVQATLDGREEAPGVSQAQTTLARHGFRTKLIESEVSEVDAQYAHGLVSILVPLETGGAEVEFFATTTGPLNLRAIFVILVAVAVAGVVGMILGRLLSRDLAMANQGVRTLGTDVALEGTRVMKPARFRAVADLADAIELLSSRFRLFANAQERAISARESATRSRGRFFASVSHDLKSPLNAILGFAQLCQDEPSINAQQKESLDLIVQRGRELLALIETILDAARVEAGQLKLDQKEEHTELLLELAISKAREITGDPDTFVLLELPEETPPLVVDRLRFAQALATLISHGLKTAERDSLRILVDCERKDKRPSLKRRKVTIHIEVPSTKFSAQELEAMLSPERHPGQHRGVSLALRLAKSILDLHGGQVKVTGRTVREPAFAIELRARAGA